MTTDYNQEQVFIIDKFKGLNKFIDPTKISPEEFTICNNVTIEEGNIKSDEEIVVSKTMPGPSLVESTWDLDDLNSNATSFSIETVSTSTYLRKFTGSLSANKRYFFALGLVSNTPAAELDVAAYTDVAGAPGSAIGALKFQPVSLTDETGGHWQWRVFQISFTSATPSTFWLGLTTTSTGTSIITTSDASGDTWKKSTGAATGWTHNPAFFLHSCDDTTVVPDKVVPLKLPGEVIKNTGITNSAMQISATFSNGGKEPGQLLYVPEASDVNEKYRILIPQDSNNIDATEVTTLSNSDVYTIPHTNVCIKDGIIYLTHCNCVSGVIIGITMTKARQAVTNLFKEMTHKFNAVYFNGNIALNTWGPGASGTNYKPMYFNLSAFNIKSYTTSVPSSPDNVGVHNLSLFYTGDQYNELPFQVSYSDAGQVDSFSGTENIDLGDNITTQITAFGKVFFFFENKIKELNGVFGNASLRESFTQGTQCRDGVVATPYGVFAVLRGGLFQYTGSWNKIIDLSTMFDELSGVATADDTGTSRLNYVLSGKLIHSPSTDEIIFQSNDNKTLAITDYYVIYNYITKQFRTYQDTAKAGLLGSMYFEQDICVINKDNDIVIASETSDFIGDDIANLNRSFTPLTIQSGWIDFLPEYRYKILNKIVIEGSPEKILPAIDTLTIWADSSSNQVFHGALTYAGNNEGLSTYVNAEGSRFRYYIYISDLNNIKNISRIKFYFTVGMLK